MDFLLLPDETALVLTSPQIRLRFRRFRPARGVPLLLTLLTILSVSACDRVKNALRPVTGDPAWQNDSTLLASAPTVLFRAVRPGERAQVVPVATYGEQGLRFLSLSNRGWRALDIDYLQSTSTVTPIRNGAALPRLSLRRGMWEGTALDSIAGCTVIVPGGDAAVPAGVELLVSGPRPPLNAVTPLGDGELQTIMTTVSTLIAPTVGVPLSAQSRYTREVHVVAGGNGPAPSIVVIYNDPDIASDSLRPIGERPRQLVIVLDKGVYGYKPSYTFSTLGNKRTPPRIKYLDYVDVDGDRKAELFFGLALPPEERRAELYTIVLHHSVDAWRELSRFPLGRCLA